MPCQLLLVIEQVEARGEPLFASADRAGKSSCVISSPGRAGAGRGDASSWSQTARAATSVARSRGADRGRVVNRHPGGMGSNTELVGSRIRVVADDSKPDDTECSDSCRRARPRVREKRRTTRHRRPSHARRPSSARGPREVTAIRIAPTPRRTVVGTGAHSVQQRGRSGRGRGVRCRASIAESRPRPCRCRHPYRASGQGC